MHLKQEIVRWLGDGWSRWLLGLLIVLNGAGWLAVWYFAPRNLDVSPLHYTIYFGINLTGRWMALFWLPGIGAAAIISHIFFVKLVDHPIWRRVWLVLALVINIMMLIDVTAMLILLRTAVY